MIDERLQVDLRVETDAAIHVASCRIEERLSAPASAEVTVWLEHEADLGPMVGRAASLALTAFGEARSFDLVVGAVRPLGRIDGHPRFQIDLYSRIWLLGFRTDTRKFRKLSAEDIVTRVIAAHGLPGRFDLVRPTPRRNYCVQYDETDRQLVERLLAFEGILYVAEDDGAIAMTDRSSALPEVDGDPIPVITAAGALRHAERAITTLRKRARVTSGKVTVSDVDWKRPALDLTRSHAADRFEALEVYDWGAGYRNGSDGEYLARIRLEALRAEGAVIEGTSTAAALKAGRVFSIDQPGCHDLLLIAALHLASLEGDAGYTNRFRAIPRAVPYRPPIVPRPQIRGHHTATVRGPIGSEIHTDQHGRFRAQFHWDREATRTDADSRWLRLVQASSTSLFLARVGWEMFVEHLDGDPDRPIGVARAINGKMPPTYGQPKHKEAMTIKTPSSPGGGGYNEWRMNDMASVMAIDVRAERDYTSHANHDQVESIGRDEVRVVQGNTTRGVDGDQAVEIGRDDERQVGDAEHHKVGGDLTRTVGGAEHVKTGDALSEVAESNDDESVGSVRLTVAGGVHVPNPVDALRGILQLPKASAIGLAAAQGLPTAIGGGTAALSGPPAPSVDAMAASLVPRLVGSISRSAREGSLRTVGGAEIAVAGAPVHQSAEGGVDEVIGGARFVIARKGDIVHKANALDLSVGAAIVRKAGEDVSYSAKRSEVTTGANATLSATTEVAVRASTIVLEGSAKMTLGNGDPGSSPAIELSPGGITLRGDLAVSTKDGIRVFGGPDDLAE